MAMASSEVAAEAPTKARRPWRPRHYVAAGMAAIVAASIVAIVTAVVLRPTRINFSVTDARTATKDPDSNVAPPAGRRRSRAGRRPGAALFFSFNLVVENPSRRAAVWYGDIVVNLEMERGRIERRAVQAKVGVPMPFEQPPANQTFMPVHGFLDKDLITSYDGGGDDDVTSTLIVMALVRFRVGLAYSRPYDIRISCSPVNFLDATYYAAKVNCSAG